MSGEVRHVIRGLRKVAEDHPDVDKLMDQAVAELLTFQMIDERIGYVMNNVRRLLEQVGKRGKCRTCGQEIWYVQLRTGMVGPYQADALNHGAGCHGDLNKGAEPCLNSSDPTPGPSQSED